MQRASPGCHVQNNKEMNASRGRLSLCIRSFYVSHLCQVSMPGWYPVHTYCTEHPQSSQPALQWGLPVESRGGAWTWLPEGYRTEMSHGSEHQRDRYSRGSGASSQLRLKPENLAVVVGSPSEILVRALAAPVGRKENDTQRSHTRSSNSAR